MAAKSLIINLQYLIMTMFQAHVLVDGSASGPALVLPEALSLWGGLEPETGEIIDRRHPNSGENVAGKVLVLPIGRGSSSASSILLEAVRQGKAPAAIVLAETDAILALGAAVAREMYDQAPPVVVVEPAVYQKLRTNQHITISAAGLLTINGDE
jgi:predicted aconitase with swiveling domain